MLLAALLFVVSGCTRPSANNLVHPWFQVKHKASYRFCSATDTVANAMHLDFHLNVLHTTVQLRDAKTMKSELFRRDEQGLHRLLTCADGTTTETLYAPSRPERGAEWTFVGCAGDTVATFVVVATDTLVRVPAGTFSTFVLREIDNTGIMTDTFIHPNEGIVKIDFLHSRLVGGRYKNNPAALPYETFELVSKNYGQRLP